MWFIGVDVEQETSAPPPKKMLDPPLTLEIVNKGLVQPYFEYCSPLWDTCGKLLKDKLQRFQSRAARVLTGASYVTVRSADLIDSLYGKHLTLT